MLGAVRFSGNLRRCLERVPNLDPLHDSRSEGVDRRGADECWPWLGFVMDNEYGKLTHEESGSLLAHRLVYRFEVGPIPDGLDIDHLCRNHACVNPSHLEPVTRRQNLARSPLVQLRLEQAKRDKQARRAERLAQSNHNRFKTHCPQGHLYDEANTYYRASGSRQCRACGNEQAKRRYWQRKGVVGP